MILSGYQPQYFPRLHYFNRLLNSDIFEISDYLQFVKKHSYLLQDGSSKRGKSYQSHSPLKLSSGLFFLSVPAADSLLPINRIRINYGFNWVDKHLKTVQTAYNRSINFSRFFPEISEILKARYPDLASLNIATILWTVFRFLTDEKIGNLNLRNINNLLKKQKIFRLKKIVIASQTPVPPPEQGQANSWIIALCRYLKTDVYFYGGTSLSAYMDKNLFKKSKIKLLLQDWTCPGYNQQYKKLGFIPNLQGLDLVMNEPLKVRQQVIR